MMRETLRETLNLWEVPSMLSIHNLCILFVHILVPDIEMERLGKEPLWMIQFLILWRTFI